MTESSTTIYYLATCFDCQPILPQPFLDQDERDQWATEHSGSTHHSILLTTDRRTR